METERLPESDDGAGDESNTGTSHQFQSDSGSESAGSESWSESTSASRFTEEERTSMALFSFIARHRLSNEAGKDLLELLKVVKAGDETSVEQLTYLRARGVCGSCNIRVVDICTRCNSLFPSNEHSFICRFCYLLGVEKSLNHALFSTSQGSKQKFSTNIPNLIIWEFRPPPPPPPPA